VHTSVDVPPAPPAAAPAAPPPPLLPALPVAAPPAPPPADWPPAPAPPADRPPAPPPPVWTAVVPAVPPAWPAAPPCDGSLLVQAADANRTETGTVPRALPMCQRYPLPAGTAHVYSRRRTRRGAVTGITRTRAHLKDPFEELRKKVPAGAPAHAPTA